MVLFITTGLAYDTAVLSVTFTAASEHDPAAIGRVPPPVLHTIRRFDGVPSDGDERDINVGPGYDPALM